MPPPATGPYMHRKSPTLPYYGLLYAAGLRRAEVVGLDVADVNMTTGAIVVRGEGNNKERRIFITNGALDAVTAWLGHRGDDPGPLLCPVRKGGAIQLRRITDQRSRSAFTTLLRKPGSRRSAPTISAEPSWATCSTPEPTSPPCR